MLSVSGLNRSFTSPTGDISHVLRNVSFDVEKGKLYTLLGPSGCGKTTTLRSIAGLETPDEGRIAIGDTAVFDSSVHLFTPPNRRQIGMVFQSYAIWPHMNVFENVAFPLRVRSQKLSERDITARVRKALGSVHMESFEQRPSTQLSGGQQQRLAMARALVMEPQVMLLDEPLSNLDALLRESMRTELRRIQQELGITTIYVTHDQSEALAISDVVAVMHNGRIVQQGDPKTIYRRPANRFVAEFIGSTNLLEGEIRHRVQANDDAIVTVGPKAVKCRFLQDTPAGQVLVSIRPENIRICGNGAEAQAGSDATRFSGRIVDQVFLGSVSDYVFEAEVGNRLRIVGRPDDHLPRDAQIQVEVHASDCLAIPDV